MMSLARGLLVLQALSSQKRAPTVSQLSLQTGLPRAAVRRVLHTLTVLGFVESSDQKHYSLCSTVPAVASRDAVAPIDTDDFGDAEY